MIPVSVLPTFAPARRFNRRPAAPLLTGPYQTIWSRQQGPAAPQPIPLNVYATADFVRIVAAVPGMSPDQIEVTVNETLLTLGGQFFPQAEADATWYLREVWSGRFQRTVALPFEVDPDQAEAAFEHGLLTVTIPKAEHARPRRIEIQAATTPKELTATTANGSEA